MERIVTVKHFFRNEIILLEEDTLNYMYIVYSGRVKVVQTTAEGKEQILAIHRAGDFFGEMALLDGKTSPATLTAMEDTRIGLISRTDFEISLLGNEKILKSLSFLLCARLREAWLRLKVLGFADAEHRVRAVLKSLSVHSGVTDPAGTLITLKLTHEEIANYASVSRETVTRLLGRFLRQGEIRLLENKHILLRSSFLEKTTGV